MRFVGALETLLDPIVAMLDALPPTSTPTWRRGTCSTCWRAGSGSSSTRLAGGPQSASWSAAPASSRGGAAPGPGWSWRCKIAFPRLPLRIEDGGRFSWPGDARCYRPGDKPAPASSSSATFRSRSSGSRPWLALIEQVKPGNVTYRCV